MRFLERRQLLEQRRVGNRHTQDAPAEVFDPGLTTPRLADRVGPGRLQLPQSLNSCQAPHGEQVAKDVRQRLRTPGIRARTRSRKPARGSSPVQRSPGTLSLAVIGPATQDERPFIITTRLAFGNRQRPVIRPLESPNHTVRGYFALTRRSTNSPRFEPLGDLNSVGRSLVSLFGMQSLSMSPSSS
jgi:hypothetical protein